MAAKAAKKSAKQKARDGTDLRLVKALSHPVRARALAILNERIASPKQLSVELDKPIGHLSYHVKRLKELGCVELVDTAPRRGATEHFYRGTTRSFLSDDNWGQLAKDAKHGVSIAGLRMINDASLAAIKADTLDSRDDRHLSCTPMDLDNQGWQEATALLADSLEGLIVIAQRSANRRANGESEGSLRATASILCFESPPVSSGS